MIGWALIADSVPLYHLYALLFAHSGLSAARISALFAIWSVVGLLAEVPGGALADRYSRRAALAMGSVCQAAGYALWLGWPAFAGYALGFVLWAVGGALMSGTVEALLFDGLAAHGAEADYPRVYGRVTAAGLVGQLPAALAATALFAVGGYPLVGWVSVGLCLGAAAVAARLPEPPRGDPEEHASYLGTLRDGLREAATHPAVRGMLIAVAALAGIDGVEEYFPLLARDWAVPAAAVPVAVLGIPLAGAAGAALAGRAGRLGRFRLAALLALGAVALAAAGLPRRPPGLAVVALFYGLYRLVLTTLDTRLQHRIEGTARATVTSVAELGTGLSALVLYGLWPAGGTLAVAALVALIAAALPRLARSPASRAARIRAPRGPRDPGGPPAPGGCRTG